MKRSCQLMSPSAALQPYQAEQQQVSAEERVQTVAGIGALRRLSSGAVISDGGEDQNVKSAAAGQKLEDHR